MPHWRGKGGMGRGKLYEVMEKEGRLGRKQRQEQDEEKLEEELRKNGESEQRKKTQVCCANFMNMVKVFNARLFFCSV